jgi:hypothetical protein
MELHSSRGRRWHWLVHNCWRRGSNVLDYCWSRNNGCWRGGVQDLVDQPGARPASVDLDAFGLGVPGEIFIWKLLQNSDLGRDNCVRFVRNSSYFLGRLDGFRSSWSRYWQRDGCWGGLWIGIGSV